MEMQIVFSLCRVDQTLATHNMERNNRRAIFNELLCDHRVSIHLKLAINN